MKINQFALGAKTLDPDNSLAFDVNVAALAPGYLRAIMEAVEKGLLDAYTDTSGRLLVSSYDLMDLAGPGSDIDDPEGGCYIPTYALLPIDYSA